MTTLTLNQSTQITYPGGDTHGHATILATLPHPESTHKSIIFTDKTPFHPVDFRWPDQPNDTGMIQVNEKTLTVDDCLTAAKSPDEARCYLDKEIPTRRDETDNWLFFVAHIVDLPYDESTSLINQPAILTVDQDVRQRLNQCHSLCHFSSLALNEVMSTYWKPNKAVSPDSRGFPNFDQFTIAQSIVTDHYSEDTYRLGKSAGKKLDRESIFTHLDVINEKVNQLLKSWFENTIIITLTPGNSTLSEIRQWHATDNKNFNAKIPCGGTHVKSSQDINFSSVEITADRETSSLILRSSIIC